MAPQGLWHSGPVARPTAPVARPGMTRTAVGAQEKLRSAVYFFIFSSLGMSTPFVPVLLSKVVTARQVGVLAAIQPIASIMTGPAAAVLADMYQQHKCIMVGSTLLGSLLLPLLLLPLSFPGLFAVLLLSALVGGKATSILDASTVDAVGSRYGTVRLWGAVGFGLCALVGGALLDDSSCEGSACFRVAMLGACAIGCVAAFMLPSISVKGLQHKPNSPAEKRHRDAKAPSKLRQLQPLLCSWRVGSFLLIVFFGGVASGMIDNFLYIHLANLGGSGTLMGWARFITCAAEVPFFR